MPDPEREPAYRIEFDPRGMIRIRDPQISESLLKLLADRKAVVIQIESEPLPLLTVECGRTGPIPVNGRTCPNAGDICPMELNVRIAPAVLPAWDEAGRLKPTD